MRGRRDPQATMLAFVDLEERVPKDHPIRTIKTVADEVLDRLWPEFDRMYSNVGRGCPGRRDLKVRGGDSIRYHRDPRTPPPCRSRSQWPPRSPVQREAHGTYAGMRGPCA